MRCEGNYWIESREDRCLRVASLSFAQLVCGAEWTAATAATGTATMRIIFPAFLNSIPSRSAATDQRTGGAGGRSRNRFAPSLLLPASFGFDKSPIGEIDEGLIGQIGAA